MQKQEETSALMAPNKFKKVTKNKKRKSFHQTTLTFKKDIFSCTLCGMTYSRSNLNDELTHSRYHEISEKGRKWSKSWGVDVSINYGTGPSSSLIDTKCACNDYYLSSLLSKLNNDKIVMIRPTHLNEVKSTLQILDVVNNELNAPHDENEFWSIEQQKGKAFVYVKNDKAIGIITMQILSGNKSMWMIYSNKNIVENSNPNFILGISRIWVCREQRFKGIATKLIDIARHNTIPNKCVSRHFVAWSQPSENGAKLALAYNSVKHKSGEVLLPCYI